METFYEDYYVLQYPNQNQVFVGIDSASGGYPYETTIQKAEKFTFSSAKAYIAVTNNREGFIIKHVECEFVLRTANN